MAFNSEVDSQTAAKLNEVFLEIVIAPRFSDDALNLLTTKKNLRVIKCNHKPSDKQEYIKVDGGLLVQDVNTALLENIKVATNCQPTKQQFDDLLFALKVVKYVKSNAIVIAKDGQTLGIGGGEVSRIWAAEKAIERAKSHANMVERGEMVMASDAFFPFSDVVELASKNHIAAIIQPGGSIKDHESIDICNEHNIPMVMTNIRHFKH